MSLRERAYFAHLARSSRPILVGPWRSEVGFECLYWLPWLAAFRERYKIPKERLSVITRGGAGVWYDAQQTADLYDYAPMDRVRKAMLADAKHTGSVKQMQITDWERKLVPVIAHDLGLRRYHWLHPSRMYQGLSLWWEGQIGLGTLEPLLRFAPVPVPHPPIELALPEHFVAVRFYHRHTWPMNDELKMWVSDLVDKIATHIPVVILNTSIYADEHQDFPIKGDNILSIAPYVTPQNNLAVQSAVLARAKAFVGTYGGTMQLAVRLHRPSAGFFAQFSGTAYAHKVLTESIGVQQGTPVFIGKPDDAHFVREVMA